MSLYVKNIIDGSCESVTLNFNLTGTFTVSTEVIKPPSVLKPWNVSIFYDNILWASYDVNTVDSDDIYNFDKIQVKCLNYIKIYFCNLGNSKSTKDEIQLHITVTDNSTGKIVYDNTITIEINISPA